MHPPGAQPQRERVAPDTAGGTSTATDGIQVGGTQGRSQKPTPPWCKDLRGTISVHVDGV